MSSYSLGDGGQKIKKILLTLLIVVAFLFSGLVLVGYGAYHQQLKPVSQSTDVVQVTVPAGSSVREIANLLKEEDLIRSAWAFEWYVRNNNAREALQAGTYPLQPNQDVREIVSILTNGKISTDLITILPGRRLDQIRNTLINNGFNEQEVDTALDPALYAGHPVLKDKPADASLEGYIYPESFQKAPDTEPQTIVKSSLDELDKLLTDEIRLKITNQGLTVHEGIILASIIEKEAGHNDDKPIIAQVFLKRLRDGMRLESDATASYGAALTGEIAQLSYRQSIAYSSAYNTYQNDGFPPGPISNFTISSLMAVINPSQTDFLYFVADDEGEDKGRSFFARTLEEHQDNIEKHCTTLCAQ